jgi:hypothetical protein
LRKRALRVGLALAVLVGCDQLLLHTALRDGVIRGNFVAPHDPPVFTDLQRRTLTALRAAAAGDVERDPRPFDARLGWAPRPGTSSAYGTFDAAGARVAGTAFPRPKSPGVARVVALGGAFTMGVEVSAAEAWPAVVDAARDDLEVVNLGVGGYGIDQMLLRLRRDGLPLEPDEVWVGLYPGGLLRATTHFLPLVHHGTPIFAFKPCFVPAADGELELVPNPSGSLTDTVRLLTDQDAFLDALAPTDYWIRRSPEAFAPRSSSLLHRSGLYRLVLTRREDGGRDPSRWLPDEDAYLARVMRGLLSLLADETRAAGAELRVLILPSRVDLGRPRAGGRPYWAAVTAHLEALGVPATDAGPALREALDANDGPVFTDGAHYTPRGQRVVAGAALAAWPPD